MEASDFINLKLASLTMCEAFSKHAKYWQWLSYILYDEQLAIENEEHCLEAVIWHMEAFLSERQPCTLLVPGASTLSE